MAKNQNELCVTVPTYFKCPISLEIMKSPVSLSTGVTYDRSSIQPWLESGKRICPATMQSISSPTFIPNLTLHRLIHIWSLSHTLSPPSPRRLLLPSSSDSQQLAFSLMNILDRVRKSEDERKVLENSTDFLSSIVELLGKFDEVNKNVELIFLILSFFDGEKIKDLIVNVNCLSKFVVVLRSGSVEAKIAVAKIVEKIAMTDKETKQLLMKTPDLFLELYNLVMSDFDLSIEAGLSALVAVSTSKSAKIKLVKLGLVQRIAEILCEAGKSDALFGKSMETLEMISTCTEGRTAICEEERCVVEIVKKLMKISEKATEHGVTVLWSVCYLFRDEKVKEILGRSNGLGKCLVLLQSNCKPIVKQMCRDLVKVLRVNYKSCLGGYDTKTTHIMPY